MEQIILIILSLGIYLFIRNNYYKFANKFLDFLVFMIISTLIYMYFSDTIFPEYIFGRPIGTLIFIIGYNIFEKRQNKYMKSIYMYFENFEEIIWIIRDCNFQNDEDILKIRDNMTKILRRKETKGKGVYIIYISKKEREIRYILLFTSKLQCESYFNDIRKNNNLERFNINNAGVLTLKCKY